MKARGRQSRRRGKAAPGPHRWDPGDGPEGPPGPGHVYVGVSVQAGVGTAVEGPPPGLGPRAGPTRVWNRRCLPRAHPPGYNAGRESGARAPPPWPSCPGIYLRRWNAQGGHLVAAGRGSTLVAAGRGGPQAAGPLNRPPWRWPCNYPAFEPRPDAGHHAAPPPGTAPAALAAAAAAVPCSPHCPQSPGPPGLPEAGDPWPRGEPRAAPGSCSPRRCALFGGRPVWRDPRCRYCPG